MQTGEGDRICHSCWQEKKRGGVWLECYPDRAADREVQLLEVFCPREANGCLWQGKLADLEEHFQECGEKPNPEVPIVCAFEFIPSPFEFTSFRPVQMKDVGSWYPAQRSSTTASGAPANTAEGKC
jgi:hypothetical protein